MSKAKRQKQTAGAAWKPAVDFNKCYLSVCKDLPYRVYLSRELYWLMGRPKFVRWWAEEGTVVVSVPYRPGKDILPIRISSSGQPYVTSRNLGELIGLGNKLYYDYDERIRGPGGKFGPRVFYFRTARSSELR
ncbi:MAG: hypothetical protein ACPLRW_13075 [Moorellales bacterium]